MAHHTEEPNALQTEDDWISFLSPTSISEGDVAKYAKILTQNAIDCTTITLLNKTLLTEMGIEPMGHKLAILQQISLMQVDVPIPDKQKTSEPTAKISAKLPTLHKDMTQTQFRKFC